MLTPFHLAIRVHDLAEARRFYGELLGFRPHCVSPLPSPNHK